MILIIPDVLTPDEQSQLRLLASQSNFVDGKETAGFRAKLVKNNEQVAKDASNKKQLQEIVVGALLRSKEFRRGAIPLRIRPPLISRYRPGMTYGVHVDDALMGSSLARDRTDVSCTVFLNDAKEYEGGELVVHSPYGIQEIKLPARYAVIYPSGTLHEVAEVTKGERLVAVTWIQSYVRDERHRQFLYDALQIRDKLHSIDPKMVEADTACHLYTNLLRLWSEN
ncbi:Fe2+-dependent dioxygenase [Dongia sp.]|uniref:Fe2+-dependent dioxygenase n=1 Tax=Dongia sp. TaxID=1977262 RepID=UPI0035B34BFF